MSQVAQEEADAERPGLPRPEDPLDLLVELLAGRAGDLASNGVMLVLEDLGSRRLVPTCQKDLSPACVSAIQLALEEGLVDWVIEQGQPRLVPSLESADDATGLLCVPLITGGVAAGAVVIPTRAAPQDLSEEALEEIGRLCDVVAPAIALSASRERSATLQARLRAVSESARALGAAGHLEENLRTVARLAYRAAPCQGSIIYLPADEPDRLECRALEGKVRPPARCPVGKGIAGWVARRDLPLAISDYAGDPRIVGRDTDPPGVGTAIAAPIHFGGPLPGVMMLVNPPGRRDFSDRDLGVLMALADQAGVAIERAHLYEDLRKSYLATIYALANAIEARDPYTRGHSERVTRMAILTARQMGWSEEQCAQVEMGGILHDVGKIGIPDAILRKPARLTDEEFAVIKTHPTLGARMLRGISYLEPAVPYILYHQERYDGRGYPRGLTGEAIPIQGRLLAVADAVDAITSNRPYRPGAPLAKAIDILKAGSGTQFDPDIVSAFLAVYESGRLEEYLAGATGRNMDSEELLGPILHAES